MVTVTTVASYALLKFTMGQVRHQLRENGSTDIHPPLFRAAQILHFADFRAFSLQIVFSKNRA